jgi:hypothetical protein
MKTLRSRQRAGLSLVLIAVIAVGVMSVTPALAANPAPTGRGGFVSFQVFLSQLRGSTYASFKEDPSTAQSASQFLQSKSYLEHLYNRVDVRASFITDGSYFDCVTVMTQPTVTVLGIKHIAQPPPNLPASPKTAGDPTLWTTNGRDQNGRVISCPAGTVPMRRITLSQVLSFHTLHAFLSKGGTGRPDSDIAGYRHAYGYDDVDNNGGGMDVNVWNPKVVSTTDDNSLSQEWVIGTQGAITSSAPASSRSVTT